MTEFERYFENKEFVWDPGLDRIKKAVEELNVKKVPSIIVAGTNGKGSTSHMICEILKNHGIKCGLFTSPHLFRFNERFKVDLKEVETEVLDESFRKIVDIIEKYNLTYFEGAFLLSLEVFSSSKVDAIVFEVGLGGRLDASNAIDHDLAVITHIDYDHKDYLGNTLEEIAKEKVAVIKGGIPTVVSENEDLVFELVKEKTKNYYFFGKDFEIQDVKVSLSGTEFLYNGKRVKTSFIGKHQAINCAVAIKASEVFLKEILNVPFNFLQEINVCLPGRFQILKKNPTVIFDVAHNKDALKRLFETAKKLGLKANVVFSSLKDKEVKENLKVVIDYLKSVNRKLFLVEIENERAMNLRELVKLTKELGFKNFSI
ncbi:MAG: Mur ligase family protein, partial [Desulfurobacteriaceae bacterium]